MIHAYDELYLERARSVMAHMLDYAVHGLGYELEDFFKQFLVSEICPKFERGQASVIAGKSGTELVLEIVERDPTEDDQRGEIVLMHRSPEYWLGWSLAYYQWYSNMHFSEIMDENYDIKGEYLKTISQFNENNNLSPDFEKILREKFSL